MKNFLITYKDKKKYSGDIEKHKKVILSNDTGEIGVDAKAALGVFINSTGTLKKIDIVSIQELDDEGNFVGLPIVPDDDKDAIVPSMAVM